MDTYRWEVGKPASQWPAQGIAKPVVVRIRG
jgi:hypothetical protein